MPLLAIVKEIKHLSRCRYLSVHDLNKRAESIGVFFHQSSQGRKNLQFYKRTRYVSPLQTNLNRSNMALGSALSRGLSFRKNKEQDSKPTRAYFQSAPTKHGFDITKAWIVSGRQPARHSALQPHQIDALTYFLSLPPTTPLLATRIAALGPPLTRPSFTNAPSCLCQAHTWFELRYIEDLMALIGKEIGPRLAKLRTCPKELLSPQTREVLQTLEPYLYLFPTEGAEAGHSTHEAECHRENVSIFFLSHFPPIRTAVGFVRRVLGIRDFTWPLKRVYPLQNFLERNTLIPKSCSA